jgi:3,4-dihydroxy 2-butanone 4-phosphate synthase/GTP cyclohydrolase II
LRAKSGGVLRRTGHTEAAVDLAVMAGFYPAGVLVEILNEDGSMARLPQLLELAQKLDLKIISIDDLVAYRMRHERLVRREFSTKMQTIYGEFEAVAYTDISSGDCHLALRKGEWTENDPVLVRVHSSTETGDILGTLLDDSSAQVARALSQIAAAGRGAFVYLRQSDKSNLLAKLQQYKQLSDEGDLEKFQLQSSPGNKDFGVGAQILRDLGIAKIRLLTNNPRPRAGFIGYGLEIVENIDLRD